MLVFRIASREYAPDNSDGARTYGGRWNKAGTPVIYTASTRSLASIEVIAHHSHIPDLYQIIAIDIDDLTMETVDAARLPAGWQTNEDTTAEIGTEWPALFELPCCVYLRPFTRTNGITFSTHATPTFPALASR